MEKIAVVGAGPAGCSAGAQAAGLGADVVIYEEHAVIGRPMQCSGVVSKKGLDALVPYSRAALNEINGAVLHLPNGDILTIETKAIVIDRAEYDVVCAEYAAKKGAKIILGKRPAKEELLSHDAVIGCDGVSSSTAKMFSFPPITDYALCYQADFDNVCIEDAHSVHAYYSREITPGFFAWVIPVDEQSARFGCGVAPGHNPKTAFERFVALPYFAEMLRRAKQTSFLAGIIPLHAREHTVKGRVLLAGDAAGHVKSTTGGGIVFSSLCGRLAGEIAANAKNEDELAEYESRWRAIYGGELEMHRRLRQLFYSFSDSMVCTYARMAKALGAEEFLAEYADMDRPLEIMRHLKSESPLGMLCNRILTMKAGV